MFRRCGLRSDDVTRGMIPVLVVISALVGGECFPPRYLKYLNTHVTGAILGLKKRTSIERKSNLTPSLTHPLETSRKG